MKSTVAVALSGGADSAVAAHVLLSTGHRVLGIHYVLNNDSHAQTQRERAEAVARHLGVILDVREATGLFESLVITPSREEYRAGRTPNPCVVCNRTVKFGALLDHAIGMGADQMATGHYARIGLRDGRSTLMRAVDGHADQSYFLYSIEPHALECVLFPLGSMQRREVSSIAAREGLVAGKSSQDICFDVFPGTEERSGDVVDLDGHIVGRHRGLSSFTIGQRRGLGIATGSPLYVVRVDAEQNEVVVGSEKDLVCRAATIRDVRWLAGHPPSSGQEVQAKVRYRAKSTPARVLTDDLATIVVFDEPQRAVAPGQSVVIYDGEEVLGGGIVNVTHQRSPFENE